MSKVEISKVADALRQNITDTAAMRRIIEQLNKIVEDAANAAEEKPPARKKQYVVLLSDPLRKMPEGEEFAAWVLQIPEDASPLSTGERIEKSAFDFNATCRGRKLPVQTVGETLECVPAKALKEVELWCKTKTPVLVVITRNELPNTDSLLEDDNRGGPKSEGGAK